MARWPGAAVLFAFVLVGTPTAADACSCASVASPCATIGADTTIFTGTVKGSEPVRIPSDAVMVIAPRNAPPISDTESATRFRFEVDSWIQGAERGKTVRVISRSATCGFPFTAGTRYLVYATLTPNGLETSICTRTGRVTDRRDDIVLLHDAKAGRVRPRLSGYLIAYRLGLGGGYLNYARGERVRRVRVAVRAADREVEGAETATDDEGHFSFGGLAPGEYAVTPALPPGLALMDRPMTRLSLEPCLTEVLVRVIRTRLGGVVRNVDGSPAGKGIRVGIVRVDGPAADTLETNSTLEFTGDAGEWEFRGLPPGLYRLGVNLFTVPSPDSPYLSFFRGPENDPTAETLIDVSGVHHQPIELRAPTPLKPRIIEGVVLDAAGRPVEDAGVTLFDRENLRSNVSYAKTNAEGRFAIRGLEGRQYDIQADTFSWRSPSRQARQAAPERATQPLTLVLRDVSTGER